MLAHFVGSFHPVFLLDVFSPNEDTWGVVIMFLSHWHQTVPDNSEWDCTPPKGGPAWRLCRGSSTGCGCDMPLALFCHTEIRLDLKFWVHLQECYVQWSLHELRRASVRVYSPLLTPRGGVHKQRSSFWILFLGETRCSQNQLNPWL